MRDAVARKKLIMRMILVWFVSFVMFFSPHFGLVKEFDGFLRDPIVLIVVPLLLGSLSYFLPLQNSLTHGSEDKSPFTDSAARPKIWAQLLLFVLVSAFSLLVLIILNSKDLPANQGWSNIGASVFFGSVLTACLIGAGINIRSLYRRN